MCIAFTYYFFSRVDKKTGQPIKKVESRTAGDYRNDDAPCKIRSKLDTESGTDWTVNPVVPITAKLSKQGMKAGESKPEIQTKINRWGGPILDADGGSNFNAD